MFFLSGDGERNGGTLETKIHVSNETNFDETSFISIPKTIQIFIYDN